MDDASLDEFLGETAEESNGESVGESGSGGEDEDAHGAADEGDGGGGAVESPDAAAAESTAVDSTRSTYTWDPEGLACADCGAAVERRWRDGDRFVCAECKAW